MMIRRSAITQWARLLASTAALVFLMKSFAFATSYIPSESMAPTLEIGDRLIVSKWPYGFSRHSLLIDPGLSLRTASGRIFGSLPARGDVTVFTHPHDGKAYIKRVIGLPGDRIRLAEGRLYINGTLVPREPQRTYRYRDSVGYVAEVTAYREHLPEGRTHMVIERFDYGIGDSMAEVTVPPGHVFMMGDNRDNSVDSRFTQMGFIPLENLAGRAEFITYSLRDCAPESGLSCASRRFLERIE